MCVFVCVCVCVCERKYNNTCTCINCQFHHTDTLKQSVHSLQQSAGLILRSLPALDIAICSIEKLRVTTQDMTKQMDTGGSH